ncbi:L-threonylcarbamoyladenylate synthase [Marivita sp. S6314]|uniref:L-threonylcarbamoyladenylate synthase n=1 Tax=Marivita sp. S6314 TaxID=2926406 RepID=UPI001FF6FB39|nr:L-threonylcarbamoyladenylate synthase [Marivita sp. S6314]MCK0151445.1 L-threonylcarbamoyladenylate synthase [Marivita sp. S6314]
MNSSSLQILPDTDAGYTRAADLWRAGGLVAFPTETVYGLGADACNDHAVARIYEAKGRPSFNPLIVHFADLNAVKQHVTWTAEADGLAQAFWPGPLTLVLPKKPDSPISKLVTAGLETLAVRLPAHGPARALLKTFGGPVAAPSANRSGQISPTQPSHVVDGLTGRIDAVLDGGRCDVGVESTIVGLADRPVLLRPGGVTEEQLTACLGHPIAVRKNAEAISAPGQLMSHYAPNAAVRLNATDWQDGELCLGFGAVECDLNLSADGDLVEAASHLFEYLHQLDAKGGAVIAVSPIPHHGLGVAINDRLSRAAAPREG